jgi:hypothetical protein
MSSKLKKQQLISSNTSYFIVKHELKGVLKYIEIEICTHRPPARHDRHLSNAPLQGVIDIAAKSNSTVGFYERRLTLRYLSLALFPDPCNILLQTSLSTNTH